MKTTHSTKASGSKVVAGVENTPKVVSGNSLFARMLKTKKDLRSYLDGKITLSELESRGIELV